MTILPFTHAKILAVTQDFEHLPKPNVATWYETDALPTDAPITGAYVIAGADDEALIVLHRTRGWDITGGHVEEETPEEAAIREAGEEGKAVVGNLRLFAVQKFEVFGPIPPGYKYPYPVSYQAVYVGRLLSMAPFEEEEDIIDRAVLPCDEALARIGWITKQPRLHERLLEAVRTASAKI
jgi:8-oxo-dGTP pyrophosphatase MutT (NUDIX family)